MEKTTKRSRNSFGAQFFRRFCKNKMAVTGFVIFAALVISAALAPWIMRFPYDGMDLPNMFRFPNRTNWFGTDHIGRDVFTRIIFGGRISLVIGVVSVTISSVFGGFLGAISGFYGGRIDDVIMRCMDILLAIPNILFAMIIAATLGPGMFNLIIAVGVAAVPSFARIVRASVLSIKEAEFIEAASLIGCNDLQIIVRHVLPNVMAPIIVQFTLGIAFAILSASTLSFIGLGIGPPSPEWGAMLAAGRQYIRDYWHIVTFPGVAIMTTILALNLLGDGLRDALDPRLKR